MSVASIPVDLFNPGQVFACLGFMELAEVLLGEARGGFDWSDPSQARFLLDAAGGADPFEEGLGFLRDADPTPVRPAGWWPAPKKTKDGKLKEATWTASWGTAPIEHDPADSFPSPAPLSFAALPAQLVRGPHHFLLAHWAESAPPGFLGAGRDNVKFWAGSGGYPGTALLRDALDVLRPRLAHARPDPFNIGAPQSSSFRFDWRRDYIPLQIGFSLNPHSNFEPQGYPLVEVLAAVGLAHARPQRGKNKLIYTYGVAGRDRAHIPEEEALLPPPMLRASLGAPSLPFPTRTFTMQLGWPGQEGQARCITHVFEETTR